MGNSFSQMAHLTSLLFSFTIRRRSGAALGPRKSSGKIVLVDESLFYLSEGDF